MADNWIQTALVALGASLVGSTSGFIANLYFTKRKEKFDRITQLEKERADSKLAMRRRQSEQHLKRMDLLDVMIAQLLEYKSLAQHIQESTREIGRVEASIESFERTVESKEDEEILQVAHRSKEAFYTERNSNAKRGRELLSELLIESERYGEMPKGLAELDEQDLSAYMNTLLFSHFDDLLDSRDRHPQETRGIYTNINALLVDLRTLAKFELDMSGQVLVGDEGCRKDEFKLPYFELVKPYFKEKTIDYSKVDTWFLEEMELRHQQYREEEEARLANSGST